MTAEQTVATNATALPERLTRQIQVDQNGCWLWTGSLDRVGYARVSVHGRKFAVHRVTYEALVGPIPSGLVVDHLCRVRKCVNPAHLEPVTQRTNTMRGRTVTAANAEKTHCKRGHLLAGENIRMTKAGRRDCRRCQALRNQERAALIGAEELRRRWRDSYARRKAS